MKQSASNRFQRKYTNPSGQTHRICELPQRRSEESLERIAVLPRHDVSAANSSVHELVAAASKALDRDIDAARRYLHELSALLHTKYAEAPFGPVLIDAAGEISSTEPVRGGLAAWQMRRVVDYIDKQIATPLRVETLAQVVRLNTGHFCRSFKANTGAMPHDFVVRRRVRRAQILMLTTSDSLSHIATASGLTDQAHLTRLFRRHVGETPMMWRRKWQTSTSNYDFRQSALV